MIAHTREEIMLAVDHLKRTLGLRKARRRAREFALNGKRTERGTDFWFAVTDILGGDTTGWRTPDRARSSTAERAK